jgi:two-component system nitrate/nitrite response regulator NarL
VGSGTISSVRVLVIDGSSAVRTRLATRLLEAGHELAGEAATADAALRAAGQLAPDAIILDVHLPDHRGADLVPAMRERAPGARLVVLSNATHLRGVCLARGADHFLDKSAEFDQVALLIVT